MCYSYADKLMLRLLKCDKMSNALHCSYTSSFSIRFRDVKYPYHKSYMYTYDDTAEPQSDGSVVYNNYIDIADPRTGIKTYIIICN